QHAHASAHNGRYYYPMILACFKSYREMSDITEWHLKQGPSSTAEEPPNEETRGHGLRSAKLACEYEAAGHPKNSKHCSDQELVLEALRFFLHDRHLYGGA